MQVMSQIQELAIVAMFSFVDFPCPLYHYYIDNLDFVYGVYYTHKLVMLNLYYRICNTDDEQ